jgi:1,2-diacylglycerol 3-alpha-glucosyltransferase
MNTNLSICMFSNVFPPIASGSSTFTWNLARNLVKRGHRISIVTAQVDKNPSYEELEGLEIYRLPSIRLPQLSIAHNFKWLTYTFTPRNLAWLERFFALKRFDIIHQQNHIFDTILSSPRMAQRFHLPLILTMHTFVQHPNRTLNALLSVLDNLARKIILEKADVVVSPDPVVQRYLATRHYIPDSPIIPYGIEVPAPHPKEVNDLAEKFGLNARPVILSLGHVNLMRDRLDLIQAMPLVLQKFPSAVLLIAGEVYVQRPVELVKDLGLENHVIFAGAVPNDQVPAIFALSSLEAHTINSDYPGPGIASMEAMSAGLPVVTGEIDGQYKFDHFQNLKNVIFVPPNQPTKMAETLIRLLADEDLRNHIGENARHMMAERYSWDAVCNAYVDLYRQCIEQDRVLK